ncbi:MAG: hypothetical protein ACKOCM_04915 [Cyanobacteriota bacterium]
MRYRIDTHDSWGRVKVGEFQTLEEARHSYAQICQDPWYRSDGTVLGVELLEDNGSGMQQRLDWFSFQP